MHRTRDRSNGMLFDPWASLGAKRGQMLERSWAGVFRRHLLTKLPIESLFEHFASGMGRPTKDLHVAVGVLILQQLHDLTDAATVEALAFNLAWHHALVPVPSCTFFFLNDSPDGPVAGFNCDDSMIWAPMHDQRPRQITLLRQMSGRRYSYLAEGP